VFLDPPYVPVSGTANFTEYQAGGFGRDDQERLAGMLTDLDRRGVLFLLTNAAEAMPLYVGKGWEIAEVKVARNINSDGAKRGDVSEILVANYGLGLARKELAA